MDKRWIYILIILIIGLTCLFFIVESSNNIGKASSKIGKCIVTIPDSMNIKTSENKNLELINRETNEKIQIQDCGKGNFTAENYTLELENLKNTDEVIDIQNTTVVVENDKMPTLCYKFENGTYNQISVLYKHNHTFLIKSMNFKDNNTINKDVESIVESLKIDYKQKQDE